MKTIKHTYVGSPKEQARLIIKAMNPEALEDFLISLKLLLESSPKISGKQFYQSVSDTAQIEVITRNLSPEKPEPKKIPDKPKPVSTVARTPDLKKSGIGTG
jgi:hypothetical protein